MLCGTCRKVFAVSLNLRNILIQSEVSDLTARLEVFHTFVLTTAGVTEFATCAAPFDARSSVDTRGRARCSTTASRFTVTSPPPF